jgi:hypothetical protein
MRGTLPIRVYAAELYPFYYVALNILFDRSPVLVVC